MPVLEQLRALLTEFQMELVIVIASLVVSAIAKRYPLFAALGDWGKRGVLFVVGAVVGLIAGWLGVDPLDLKDLLLGGGAALAVGGTVFKIARTTPTTAEASRAMQAPTPGVPDDD